MKLAHMVILACTTALAVPSLALADAAQTQTPEKTQTPAPAKPAPGMMQGPGMMRGPGGMMHPPLSKEEFDAKVAAAYKDADAKKDGKVTLEEFKAHVQREQVRRREARQAAMFKRLDANGDGTVSAEEFKTHADRMYQRMQDRRDGKGNWRQGGHMGMMQDYDCDMMPMMTPE